MCCRCLSAAFLAPVPPASVKSAGNVLRAVQSTSAHAAGLSNLRVEVLSLPDKLLTNRLVAQTAAQPGKELCLTLEMR
jgi:uncharacterized lipoprotein YmbA